MSRRKPLRRCVAAHLDQRSDERLLTHNVIAWAKDFRFHFIKSGSRPP